MSYDLTNFFAEGHGKVVQDAKKEADEFLLQARSLLSAHLETLILQAPSEIDKYKEGFEEAWRQVLIVAKARYGDRVVSIRCTMRGFRSV